MRRSRCRSLPASRKVRAGSDLKVAFANSIQTSPSSLSRLETHGFQLVADFVQPPLKFGRFHLDANAAALANNLGFAGLLEFPHQKRILKTTLRARDADRLVFKHS